MDEILLKELEKRVRRRRYPYYVEESDGTIRKTYTKLGKPGSIVCKEALIASDGDIEKALVWVKENYEQFLAYKRHFPGFPNYRKIYNLE